MTARQQRIDAMTSDKKYQARLMLQRNAKKIFTGTENPKGVISYGEVLAIADYMAQHNKDSHTITVQEVQSLIPNALAYKPTL